MKVQVNFVFSSVLTFLMGGGGGGGYMEMQMLLISLAMLCILNQERRRRKMQVKLFKKTFFTLSGLKIKMLGKFEPFQGLRCSNVS